ncbi:MAG: hypothetical protein ACR2HJ_04260 [Fimbriimonadales bacterium]
MDRSIVAEVLKQVWEGDDIPAPAPLLRMAAAQAAEKLPGTPYSILTNLAHAEFWQRIWLNRLQGIKASSFMEDWRVPHLEEWPVIRRAFLTGMEQAMAMASAKQLNHKMKSDPAAVATLLNIAVHNAYHLGQINVLKRMQRLQKQSKG